MRRGMILLIGLLAALIAIPTIADGQGGIPNRIFNTLAKPMNIIARGLAGRRLALKARQHRKAALARLHRARALALRRKAVLARSGAGGGAGAVVGAASPDLRPSGQAAQPDAQAVGGDRGQIGLRPSTEPSTAAAGLVAATGWVGPLYWPYASDDLFDYAFRPASGERFWTRGGRDLSDAILMRSVDSNVGWGNLCGSQRGSGAGAWIEPIALAVQPTDAQRRPLDELGSALAKASDGIKAACPAWGTAANPVQRLDAMTDRIWAMRQALVVVRTPLENFSNGLDAQQKPQLDGTIANTGRENAAEVTASSGGPPQSGLVQSGLARQCADPAAAMTPWPSEQIEKRVRPTPAQRQSLQTLQMTTQGMAQLLLASCPTEVPATALRRLDAAEKRLNALLYAVRVVGPALHGFYSSLSEEQKAAFNAIGRGPDPRQAADGAKN